jgi:hypothetical protein
VRSFGLRVEIYDEQEEIEIGVSTGAAGIPKFSKHFDFRTGP